MHESSYFWKIRLQKNGTRNEIESNFIPSHSIIRYSGSIVYFTPIQEGNQGFEQSAHQPLR